MIRLRVLSLAVGSVMAASVAGASDAETSAWARNGRGLRSGTAGATAHYTGDVGFARTDSHSGSVSGSRGVAVGVDRDGMSLSVSRAVAPQRGPALATTFNLSVGRDGRVSGGTGLSVARGGRQREVSAGGNTSTRRGRPAVVHATGRTDRGGVVRAATRSHSVRSQPVPVRRVMRPRGRHVVKHERPVIDRGARRVIRVRP